MKRVPPALVVGLAMYVLGDLGRIVFHFVPTGLAAYWGLAGIGTDIASYALIAFGLGELARRTPKRALRVAYVLFAIAAAWIWARPIVEILMGESRMGTTWLRYSHIAWGAVMTASVIALVVAADGIRRAPLASALPIVALLGQAWIPGLNHVLLTYLDNHADVAALYWLFDGLSWCGGMFVLARLVAVEPQSDVRIAVSGLRIVERALKFRVAFVLVVGMGIGMVSACRASHAYAVGMPLVGLATLTIAALGCLLLASANRQGCMQIVIGGALVLWSCAMHLQANAFLQYSPRFSIEAWSLLGPLAAAVGFSLVGFGVLVAVPALREALTSRLVVASVLMIGAAMMQRSFAVAGLASIVSCLVFASFARRAADALAPLGVPEARVVSTSQP